MVSPAVSSIAQVGFAAAGTAIAGPIGGMVGSMLGGLLFGFGGGPDVEGPRLNDLEVSSAAYGTVIPRGYALAKMGGSIIWATEIVEQKNVEEVGGGWLSDGQKVTTYKYFANVAVAFGEGPATSIRRIWGGSKLLWDRSEAADDIEDGISITEGGAYRLDTDGGGGFFGLSIERVARIRPYLGTEDQEPDPFMADKIQQETGEANITPAHRGLVYVVIEGLPLEDFGNRIPPFTAEINWRGADTKPTRDIEKLTGTSVETREVFAPDWNRWVVFYRNGSGLSRVRLDTMTEEFYTEETLDSNDRTPRPTAVTRSGWVIGTNSQTRHLIDPDSLQVVAEILHDGVTNPTHLRSTTIDVQGVTLSGTPGQIIEMVGDIHVVGGMLIYVIRGESLDRLWIGDGGDIPGGNPKFVVGGRRRLGFTDLWFISVGSGGVVGLLRFDIQAQAVLDPRNVGDDFPIGVELSTFEINASDVDPAATTIVSEAAAWMPDLDSLVVMFELDTGRYWTLVDRDGNVSTTVAIPFGLPIGGTGSFHHSRLLGTQVAFNADATVLSVDMSTEQILINEGGFDADSLQGYTVYDSLSDTIFSAGAGGAGRDAHRIFLRRSANEVPLSEVVSDLCETAGLSESEFDVTDLTDIVKGFVIARQTSFRVALDLLAQAYLFDAVENDFQLEFRKLGRAAVRSISEDDLVPVGDENETYIESRTQDFELPRRVTIKFRDEDRDADPGVQIAQRVRSPDQTMRSNNEVTLEIPLTLSASEAKGIVQRLLFSAWVERVSYKLAQGWSNVDLNAGDSINIVRANGEIFTIRLIKLDLGANFELEIEAVKEEPNSYDSTPVTDGGRLYRRFEVPGSPQSRLAIMSMPLLEDSHSLQRQALQIYWAAGPASVGNWPGGELFYSADGFSLAFVGEQIEGMGWGIVTSPVGDTDLPFQYDEDNEIEVFMRNGTPVTITELEMLQGGNRAALIDADGSVEIVHYRDATVDPDIPTKFTLSFLLRGRRGTENFTGGHATGTMFVMLDDAATFERQILGLSNLDETKSWKFLGRGQSASSVRSVRQDIPGRDLMPYAPVHHAASGGPLGTADITLTWERRSRILGKLANHTGTVPLAEDSEEYELEILPQADGQVIRTVTGLTSKSYTYELADQQTDFENFVEDTSVENTGAEDGDLSGWTLGDTGSWEAAGPGGSRFGNIDPRTGNFFFWPTGGSSPELGQRVDVSGWSQAIDTGAAEALLSAWTAPDRNGADTSRVKMIFRDADLNSLGDETPTATDPSTIGVYEEVTAQGTIPANTRFIDIFIEAFADSVNAETGFDDVSLSIQPGLTNEIAFAVYQISAQVGRGFRGVGTVEVF